MDTAEAVATNQAQNLLKPAEIIKLVTDEGMAVLLPSEKPEISDLPNNKPDEKAVTDYQPLGYVCLIIAALFDD